MTKEITECFHRVEINENNLNEEGKRQLINSIVEKMLEDHLNWLIKLLRDRYYRSELLREEEE